MTLLRLEDIGASFARGTVAVPVLRGVSLEVRAGEFFAIYGRRAAGKTTLLEIAAGIVEPDCGSVCFDGHDVAALSRRRLARLHREDIGWVERAGPLAGDIPIRIYTALPLYREVRHRNADHRAVAILERVGAGDYIDALWADLPDTGRTLVAIAHALIRQPRLLVVDDPIRGLGVTEREVVIGLLREAAEDAGVAVLLALPEMPGIVHADEVRVLANGGLVGPPPVGDDVRTVVEFRRPRSA